MVISDDLLVGTFAVPHLVEKNRRSKGWSRRLVTSHSVVRSKCKFDACRKLLESPRLLQAFFFINLFEESLKTPGIEHRGRSSTDPGGSHREGSNWVKQGPLWEERKP